MENRSKLTTEMAYVQITDLFSKKGYTATQQGNSWIYNNQVCQVRVCIRCGYLFQEYPFVKNAFVYFETNPDKALAKIKEFIKKL